MSNSMISSASRVFSAGKIPPRCSVALKPPSRRSDNVWFSPKRPTKRGGCVIRSERNSTKQTQWWPAFPDQDTPAYDYEPQPIEELPPKLQEIVKSFQAVEERFLARIEHLMSSYGGMDGKPLMDDRYKTESWAVDDIGWNIPIWIRAYLDDDNKNLIFEADSEELAYRSIANLLAQGLSGSPPSAILRIRSDFIDVMFGVRHSDHTWATSIFFYMKKLALYAELSLTNNQKIEEEDGDDMKKQASLLDLSDDYQVEDDEAGNVQT